MLACELERRRESRARGAQREIQWERRRGMTQCNDMPRHTAQDAMERKLPFWMLGVMGALLGVVIGLMIKPFLRHHGLISVPELEEVDESAHW